MIFLKQLSKSYGPTIAVKDVSLTLETGEKCCLVGPTGSGKTTVLRLVAGFEQPDQGEIFLGGKLVSSKEVIAPPHERKIGMVFQNLALWPHLNVLRHLLLLMDFNFDRKQKEERAREILDLMGLAAFSKNYPDMLSGGQRQKLAIARMISCNPEIALLDEPFAHLDPDNKAEVRRLVQEWIKKNKITFIMVTHDPLEDFSYFDSIAVMERGSLRYQGSPEDMRYLFKSRNPENQVWSKL